MTVDAEIILTETGRRGYASSRVGIEARWRGGSIAAINKDLSQLNLYNYQFIVQDKPGSLLFLQTLLIIVDQDEVNFYVMRDSRMAHAYRTYRHVLKTVIPFTRRLPRLFRWLQRLALPEFNLPKGDNANGLRSIRNVER